MNETFIQKGCLTSVTCTRGGNQFPSSVTILTAFFLRLDMESWFAAAHLTASMLPFGGDRSDVWGPCVRNHVFARARIDCDPGMMVVVMMMSSKVDIASGAADWLMLGKVVKDGPWLDLNSTFRSTSWSLPCAGLALPLGRKCLQVELCHPITPAHLAYGRVRNSFSTSAVVNPPGRAFGVEWLGRRLSSFVGTSSVLVPMWLSSMRLSLTHGAASVLRRCDRTTSGNKSVRPAPGLSPMAHIHTHTHTLILRTTGASAAALVLSLADGVRDGRLPTGELPPGPRTRSSGSRRNARGAKPYLAFADPPPRSRCGLVRSLRPPAPDPTSAKRLT